MNRPTTTEEPHGNIHTTEDHWLSSTERGRGFGQMGEQGVSAWADEYLSLLDDCESRSERLTDWVSVTDRLPEPDNGEVLVWLTKGRCAFDEWHMHHEDPTGMGGATLEMGPMWRDYEFDEVTHWMPLPRAPQ